MTFKKPEPKSKSFTCPHCGVLAMQVWSEFMTNFDREHTSGWELQRNMDVGKCDYCSKITIWLGEDRIYPDNSNMPLPNEDLEDDIKQDYKEATTIVEKSPRAASALLRLAIEKLCNQLEKEGKTIDEKIGKLVKRGLDEKIQQALDIVRVIGNGSVHPGQINLNDNKETAYKLFELVNLIAYTMITQKKEIDNLYNSLPSEKLEGIKKRDED